MLILNQHHHYQWIFSAWYNKSNVHRIRSDWSFTYSLVSMFSFWINFLLLLPRTTANINFDEFRFFAFSREWCWIHSNWISFLIGSLFFIQRFFFSFFSRLSFLYVGFSPASSFLPNVSGCCMCCVIQPTLNRRVRASYMLSQLNLTLEFPSAFDSRFVYRCILCLLFTLLISKWYLV